MKTSTPSAIQYWNRKSNRQETELVYGDAWIRWAYTHPLGKAVTDFLLTRAPLSQAFGAYQSSSQSAKKIPRFIEQYKIAIEDYEPGPYPSFNDFFIRKFKPGRRSFDERLDHLPAFAEGRYFAYEKITEDLEIPVKGKFLTAQALLGEVGYCKWGPTFDGGPLLLCRLCPTDYHRFHFPIDGQFKDFFAVHGQYHSVNPIALAQYPHIFAINERQISVLETQHFGKLAYIEVGAMCVGKIIQSHPTQGFFRRGDEKGYFLFGASTVIVLGESGRWKPSDDLIQNTQNKMETLIQLGESVAHL